MAASSEKTALVYFVFNRPACVKEILPMHVEYTKRYNIDLIIVCDGPRHNSDRLLQKELIKLLHDHHLNIAKKIQNKANLGLKENILSNLDQLATEYDQLLVFEEDVVPTNQAYLFLLRMLKKYALEDSILSINSYSPVNIFGSLKYYKHPIPHSWGWAIWSNRWLCFTSEENEIKLNSLNRKFDLHGAFSYRKMLKDNIDGKINSWAILFYYHSFKHRMFSITPTRSLVKNIGFGDYATHTKGASLNFYNERLKIKDDVLFKDELLAKPLLFLAYLKLLVKNITINITYAVFIRVKKIFQPNH